MGKCGMLSAVHLFQHFCHLVRVYEHLVATMTSLHVLALACLMVRQFTVLTLSPCQVLDNGAKSKISRAVPAALIDHLPLVNESKTCLHFKRQTAEETCSAVWRLALMRLTRGYVPVWSATAGREMRCHPRCLVARWANSRHSSAGTRWGCPDSEL